MYIWRLRSITSYVCVVSAGSQSLQGRDIEKQGMPCLCKELERSRRRRENFERWTLLAFVMRWMLKKCHITLQCYLGEEIISYQLRRGWMCWSFDCWVIVIVTIHIRMLREGISVVYICSQEKEGYWTRPITKDPTNDQGKAAPLPQQPPPHSPISTSIDMRVVGLWLKGLLVLKIAKQLKSTHLTNRRFFPMKRILRDKA